MAETARTPFDLTEAESELVAGYQTEYSSMSFALFWLGEYANVLLMCALNAILFFGGWLPPLEWEPLYWIPGWIWLFAKIFLFFFVFSWVKATVPRFRYDQLMRLGWKVFLPFSLTWVVLVSGWLMFTRYDEQTSFAYSEPTRAALASLNASDACELRPAGSYGDQSVQILFLEDGNRVLMGDCRTASDLNA
jgi:NADH-quinone oxidoreductase subunit H